MRFRNMSAAWIAFLLSITILAVPATGNIQASFGLDQSTWNATQIVLVKTTDDDAVFAVLKSWKGELKPGDSLDVPELKPANNAAPISDYPKPPGSNSQNDLRIGGQIPRQPVGSQMILFLKRERHGGAAASSMGFETQTGWQPANPYGDMRFSVVWIDGGTAFCFRQWRNPGPDALAECGQPQLASSDVAAVTSRIQQVVQVQRDLAETLEMKNLDLRAERLGRFGTGHGYGNVYEAKIEAIEALAKSGTIAIPEMLQVMDDPPAEFYDGHRLIRLFAQAAGKDSGRLLLARLQQDVIYWKNVGPTLTQNWISQLLDVGSPLFVKFNETVLLVQELDKEKYAPATQTVADLRDFWVSQPQLYDPEWGKKDTRHGGSGLDLVHADAFGLAQACDAFLRHAAVGNHR